MKVAIHQPNYLPWLGYFYKIAHTDIFIFLDDVQYTKGGYTNRVQVLSPKGQRWLTIPVSVHLGDPVSQVKPAKKNWAASHLDCLRQGYQNARAFRAVWPEVKKLLLSVPESDLAAVNSFLVKALAQRLGLACEFRNSSQFVVTNSADLRLVELVSQAAPGGTYLSGKGGAKYQDPEKFLAAGLGFSYLDFEHPEYDQGEEVFIPGLSVMDPIFHLGWEKTAALLRKKGGP